MKYLITLLLILTYATTFSQEWEKVGNTSIYYSRFIHKNQDNWNKYSYEYFRKNGNVIAFPKYLAMDFYALFKDEPRVFDSLFKVTRYVTTKIDSFTRDLDTNVYRVNFKKMIVFEQREETIGHAEIIWTLRNNRWDRYESDPCFVTIALKRYKKRSISWKGSFLSVSFASCWI